MKSNRCLMNVEKSREKQITQLINVDVRGFLRKLLRRMTDPFRNLKITITDNKSFETDFKKRKNDLLTIFR